MRIDRIIGTGFRNLADFDLPLDPMFTVLHGENAQGKTNTLEAIWYLCSLKPLRTARIRDLIRWEGESAALACRSTSDGIESHRKVQLEPRQRTLELDGKRTDLGGWFDGLRAIVFQPADTAIVRGSPDHRRRWVDRAAFTARPAHLELVRAHQRVLANKGAALRADRPDSVLLDALDEQLAHLGAQLADRRAALLTELGRFVPGLVETLAGSSVEVEVRLRTVARGQTLQERHASLVDALRRQRSAETRRGRSLTGVQMDDVVVLLQGHPARSFASQGQVRTLVLALKLAELMAARERGQVPLFLLDDLSSELDQGRTGRLIRLLADLGAQVVATTTDPRALVEGSGAPPLQLHVENGRIRP